MSTLGHRTRRFRALGPLAVRRTQRFRHTSIPAYAPTDPTLIVTTPRARATVLAMAVALLTAACGGAANTSRNDDSASEPSDATSPDTTTTGDVDPGSAEPRSDPELFEGSTDAFYEVPDPLPAGEPGDLIRYQVLSTQRSAPGADQPARERTTVRVMYHSNDASGADRATTGIVTFPQATPPDAGWPVVSYAHGTAGMAPRCAPSRDGLAAPGWGVEGVWAATDYVGLGPLGEVHPYLSKAAEGNAVIDIVRAAAQVPGSGAGARWVAVGHSQGGHAALAAHELSTGRAPGLELVATVAVAPAVGIEVDYGIDGPLMTVLTMMQIHGAQSEHDGIDLARYLSPDAMAATEVFDTGCVDEIAFELVSSVVAGSGNTGSGDTAPFVVDPWRTPPAASVLRANQVGTRAVTGVPVLLVSGSLDATVLPERVDALFGRLCSLGQQTVMSRVPGADHGSVIPAAAHDVADFLDAALAGHPRRGGAGTC